MTNEKVGAQPTDQTAFYCVYKTMIVTGSILFKIIIKVTGQLNHFLYNVTEAGEQKTKLI